MYVFRVYARLMLATLVVLGAFQLSESFKWEREPHNPTIVVEGVNSTDVPLEWEFTASTSNYIVIIERQRPDDVQSTQIASRTDSTAFEFTELEQSSRSKYAPKLPATLVLKDVKRNDEYVYTVKVLTNLGVLKLSDQVTVDVVVPPKIRDSPKREPELNLGQNETLKCNASGDPHPSITWTKDGIPVNQFNASGYLLHLVNVQRKDAGSYRCTASNGYGDDATAVSIVGIKCSGSSCKRVVVGIRLSDKTWKSAYSNQASVEFKNLESELLSEVSRVYAKNSEIPIYRMVVDNFRSGSVFATIELTFGNSQDDTNLKPLKDDMADKKLGQLAVDPELVIDPTTPPPTSPTEQTTTVTQEPPDTGARGSGGLTNSEMWGIIGGCIAFVLLIVIIILICYIWKRGKNSGGASKGGKSYSEADGDRMNRQQPPPSGLGTASPAYVEARQYAPVTAARKQDRETPLQFTSMYTNSFDNCILGADAPATTLQSPAYSDQEYMPLDPTTKLRNWEISREQVHVNKMIGKGAFSQVAKAMAWNINGIKGLTIVAVKMLKENAPDSDRKDLLSELELMKKLKPHAHVIKLIGCVTETDPLLVLIEYIPYGDLLGYLRKSRGLNDTYFKDPDVKPQTNLTSQQLMQFSRQIADGMNYLCSSKIIHRDLAARNVLVGEGEKCKVTDFGMARNVQQDDIYTKQSRGRLPVKWTAYEALLYGKYTTQSDVWSFGVVLYEIFTVGGSPYSGINGREIANKLQKGYRMPKPKHVDDQLYQIMLQCWQENPNDRPTFSALKDTITKMAQSKKDTYVNMKEYDTHLYSNVDDLFA